MSGFQPEGVSSRLTIRTNFISVYVNGRPPGLEPGNKGSIPFTVTKLGSLWISASPRVAKRLAASQYGVKTGKTKTTTNQCSMTRLVARGDCRSLAGRFNSCMERQFREGVTGGGPAREGKSCSILPFIYTRLAEWLSTVLTNRRARFDPLTGYHMQV